jgi:queuine tRNA-ribosyltransferase
MMNTFHLMQRPGSSTIQALGGLHRMSGWPGPLITDSGGFQAYSMIRQNPKYGRLTERGLTFQPDSGRAGGRKYHLTPEKTVQLQIGYGSDVVICLDDCTHVDAGESEQREAVRRTVAWARRGKEEYLRQLEQRKTPVDQRPLLFAVIQGGGVKEYRRECAESLLEIGFDGFGFGGWPLDASGVLLSDIIGYTRELVPRPIPMHALGVGHPENVLACYRLGYDLFDSAMPTRDARHGRLYTFTTSPTGRAGGLMGEWLEYVYIGDDKHIKADQPVSPLCDALCCTRYSRGYLHHLFKIDDSLFLRLATLHNLRFMTQLTERIRSQAGYPRGTRTSAESSDGS